MSVLIRTVAGLEDAADLFLGGDVSDAWIRTEAGLEKFYSAFAASATPAFLQVRINSSLPLDATTGSATASVEGAIGAVTYAWTQSSGDAGWSATSPGSATTAFKKTALAKGMDSEAVFTVTVTDQGGHSETADVGVSASNIYGGTL